MRYCAGLAACALLASCGSESSQDSAPSDPAPALWEIASPQGETEGWLFGTIHALPDGTEWKTEKLQDATDRAQVLVVEIAALEDSAAIARIFYRLALTPGQAVLEDRVSPARREKLRVLMAEGGMDKDDFNSTESWAAALTLAQLASFGDPENGVDRALIRAFAGKKVLELEGAAAQLAIFDSLPEREQIDLLNSVIDAGANAPAAEAGHLAELWRTGDVDALVDEIDSGMLNDPELRAALLTDRNIKWASRIERLAADEGPMLVAVGAAHLAGREGLPVLLEERGFTVSRIQ